MKSAAPRVALVAAVLSAAFLGWRDGGVVNVEHTVDLPIPSFATVRAAYRPSDARLLDRHGVVLHELRIDPTRRRLQWYSLDDISPAFQAAVVASEDRRFYRHGGIDVVALLAAAWARARGGPLRGASTISMQLAALLEPELRRHDGPRSPAQKWRQMRWARALEAHWSKKEILEAYLNLVTFRGELQGVGAAASTLFGKAPHGVTEPEAGVLAVLIKSPNAVPAVVIRRANALGGSAGKSDPGSGDDLERAAMQALSAPPGTAPRVMLAPHVAHLLLQASTPMPVQSTLDAGLQQIAIDALRRNLLAVRDRRVQDGSILVVDNASGEVRAYVGSSGDLSQARHVDGVRAKRQAGSALKPLLYGLALDLRLLTPASLIDDTPLEIAVAGGLYRPQNYDEQFRGPVTLRTALAASLNVPAVRTLQLVGAETFVQQLKRLGFTGMVERGDYYGPALALGSADVSLWELTNAYRTLANGGVWSPLRLTRDEPAASATRVYSEPATFLISNILSDRASRSPTFGLDNPLATRFWSAVKTGTSKDMRDNWCVGYSRRYTVGVWVGNFSGQPMADVSGVTGAAPIWLEVMSWLHRETASPPPEPPAGVEAATVAPPRGVEPPRIEWFLTGTQPLPSSLPEYRTARIVAPVSGTVIALDPDIPDPAQRIVFETNVSGARLSWVLDGNALGPAAGVMLWSPQPGKHTLLLADDHQRTLDAVTFEVRGSATRIPAS